MQLTLIGFVESTRRFAAGAQAATTQALDFTTGSVFRALAEAQAAVALWVQWQIVKVLGMTRLSTSTGVDVDTFVADFGLTRLPGVAAVGNVTLSRYASNIGALIVPGTLVRTADNTATFTVTANTTHPSWSTTAGAVAGYFLPPNVTSVTVPVVATVAGQVGNVGAGTITLLASAVPGIDTVTNAAPMAGGQEAESDGALQTRFAAFIASLSQATDGAIKYAVTSLQQNLAVQVVDGATGSGLVTVYVDDGTGSPSSALLATVGAAIEPVRPAGVRVAVLPPTLIAANIAIVLSYPVGATVSVVQAAVNAAVSTYLNGLQMAQPVSYARLSQIVLDAAPSGADIASMTVNGGTAPISVGVGQRAHLNSLTVS